MLTDAAIRKIGLRDKPYKVSDMHGLYLLVNPNGARYWRWNFSHRGKRQTLSLGVYPEVSLKEAREKRTDASKLLERGTNPSAHKKLARALALNGGTSFGEVAQEWLAKMEAEGRSKATMEIHSFLYAGCFFTVAVVQLASLIALWGIRIEKPRRTPTGGRPIGVFLRMPVFVVGVTCCAIGYALMSYLMTATPLQVVNVAKLGTSANATIIQWHVVAMFLPSFFTGHIIARLGAFRVLWTGVLFYGTTIFLAVSASGFWGYWLALATLGLGWNFLFIGGTSLVARVAEPEERGRVQGLADLVTMTTVAAASLSAGAIHSQLGWQAVSLAALGPVLIVSMSLIWLGLSSQKQIMGSQGR